MLKTIRSYKISVSKEFGANNNEVIESSNSSKVDEIVKILAKSKKN